MRKPIMILGTLVITAVIIISGPAIAGTWHYGVSIVDYYNCSNPNDVLGAPDGEHCTLGTTALELGWIIVNLSYGHEMGSNQEFWVFADSACTEYYYVVISTDISFETSHEYLPVSDDTDHYFFTPNEPTAGWLYIMLVGYTGVPEGADPHYGPEVDAVGWYEDE
jgi:hypothetical protein